MKMHSYSTDSNEKKYIPPIIASISVILTWLLNKLFGSLPWFIESPSVMGFYGILHFLIEKYLLGMTFLRNMRLIKIPDLNGKWIGHLVSSYDGHINKYDATMGIYQNWSKISIQLTTQKSKSYSVSANIIVEDQNPIVISYEYINEPVTGSSSTMHTHRGTVRMFFNTESQIFEGDYYSGRDRQNIGTLNFSREKEE